MNLYQITGLAYTERGIKTLHEFDSYNDVIDHPLHHPLSFMTFQEMNNDYIYLATVKIPARDIAELMGIIYKKRVWGELIFWDKPMIRQLPEYEFLKSIGAPMLFELEAQQ